MLLALALWLTTSHSADHRPLLLNERAAALSVMRQAAIDTALDALGVVSEVAAALVAERIERAVAKKAVESPGGNPFMAGEVLAGGIREKGTGVLQALIILVQVVPPPFSTKRLLAR